VEKKEDTDTQRHRDRKKGYETHNHFNVLWNGPLQSNHDTYTSKPNSQWANKGKEERCNRAFD